MLLSSRTSILTMAAVVMLSTSCSGQTKPSNNKTANKSSTSATAKAGNFKEGKDYFLFDRVRLMDKVAFTQPVEAYSVLLPKGWTQQSAVMKGSSNSNYCRTGKPVTAEEYLRTVYGPGELGNPEVVSVKPNEAVVKQLMEGTNEVRQEMMGYGAAQVNFYPSAINAKVKWPDGKEALLVIGVRVMEGVIPNPYNGTSSTIYTTQVTNCDVFTYPAGMNTEAENIFVMIMSSFRSNPAWNDAVNKFWKDARTRSNIAHVGRIKMIDDQTRAIGNRAIANGQARLNDMDNQMRSWEQTQNSKDRMHTEFIKTIREVENYRDETGKIELLSGFDHAWSRSDGSSFILSNNPNFDPAAVALDNRWKEMKKVD